MITHEKHSLFINTKREPHEVTSNLIRRPNTHVIVVCAGLTRPSTDSRASTSYQPNTHGCQVALSHQEVVELFCPSFKQSERLLHTDQIFTSLQVAVMTNFIRMLSGNVTVNVFKADAAILRAAIFRTFSSIFDKLLHLSKSQGSAMNRLRRHDLPESIRHFLTVSMHLQDSLSRFHRPGLRNVDFRVNMESASTRTVAFHECQSCSTVHAQHNRPR